MLQYSMQFTVDGFPRQGNTTLIRIIKNVFGEDKVAGYPSHDLALIERGILSGSVMLSPVRSPKQTLASFCEMQMLRFPENREVPKYHHMIFNAFDILKTFQEYIIQNIEKIYVIKFEDIIQMSEDYKNKIIENNRIINKLSEQYVLKKLQRIDPLFDSFSTYSSTKNQALEIELCGDEYKEMLDLVTNNYNFLVSKSY